MFYFSKKYLILMGTVTCLITGGIGTVVAAQDILGHQTPVANKYYCPMHPQVVSDKPGNCPICHMKLVLRDHADSSSPETTGFSVQGRLPVTINDTERKRVDIRTTSVQWMPFKKTMQAWGHVAHDPELYQLQIDFLREEVLNYQREKSRTPVSQLRGLTGREKIAIKFSDLGLSGEWVKALEEAGVPDKRLLFHDNAGGVWVYIQLREKDASLIKNGDLVTMQATGLQDAKLTGKVEFMDNKIDMETGTIRARVLVENVPPGLKPDMAVSGSIAVDLGNTLVVSEDTPLFTGSRVIVFVDEKGVFKPREVILGNKVNGYYEVKEGLMAGEKVASNGNFFIDSESRLRSSVAGAHEGSMAS